MTILNPARIASKIIPHFHSKEKDKNDDKSNHSKSPSPSLSQVSGENSTSTRSIVDGDNVAKKDGNHLTEGEPKRFTEDKLVVNAHQVKDVTTTQNDGADEVSKQYGEVDFDHPSILTPLDQVIQMPAGERVSFRARIHTQRSLSTKLDFVIFRQRGLTIQGILSDECSPSMIKWVEKLPSESIVQVSGILQNPPQPILADLDCGLEVKVEEVHLVEAAHHIPFNVYNYSNGSVNTNEAESSGPPRKDRLANRVVDLRHPSNQAIFRIRAKLLSIFRKVLEERQFLEIQTPKLQPAATESGAQVFKVNYFGRKAFLAQSPQLAKQMAISADFGRVYEIGPVFRAENSNTHRHLTEYTGLDIEMSIEKDYHEVFDVLDSILKAMFAELAKMKSEVDRVREYYPSDDFLWLDKTLVLSFAEAVQMLRDDGREVDEEDLSTPDEIRLGHLIRDKFKTDYYVIDRFPKAARPFYTVTDGEVTNSFDIFIRGQEVCTGGQRINDPTLLRERMDEAGIDQASMEEYLAAFDWGMPPHGGGGLGLERIVAFYLDLADVRLATLFHRDPKSLPAREPSLPHPTADTTKPFDPSNPPSVGDLIANYGDATNTSWLDDRFHIWRDGETGSAVGYVPQGKFCMITGDPLCDEKQLAQVTQRFLQDVNTELKLKPVWMLVSEGMQDILADEHGWRSISVTCEQRTSSDNVDPNSTKKANKEKKGKFKVRQVDPESEQGFMERVDERIEEWKSTRQTRGKQVHLTEVAPWRDINHRKYFVAESTQLSEGQQEKEKKTIVNTLVVLTRLSPKNGYQVKWALDFPSSPNGAIESTINTALNSDGVAGEPVTFGTGISENFIASHGVSGLRAKFMERTYKGLVKSLALDKKSEFREKFGVRGEETFICFPKHGVKVNEIKEIVKFFEE